ncbi:MAG TPA: hypothetical protein VMA37_03930 [Acetobacteraceae bacterium]|nr:hypothetical protein [Acetobacteraceae bacterium]
MIRRPATRRFTTRTRFSGLLAALIALAGQIALGAVILRAPTQPSPIATLDAASLLCGPSSGPHKAPTHHPASLALAALTQALAQSTGLLGSASVALCVPAGQAPSLLRPPSLDAPPSLSRLAAQPRAPPFPA